MKTVGERIYDHMVNIFCLSYENKRKEKYLVDMGEATLEDLTQNEILLLPVCIAFVINTCRMMSVPMSNPFSL